jgi:hypothetical protein
MVMFDYADFRPKWDQKSLQQFPGPPCYNMRKEMNAMILFIGWCILFVLCWPLAILALILLPIVWLLSIPLRLIGISVGAALALLKGILFLPARLLGFGKTERPAPAH